MKKKNYYYVTAFKTGIGYVDLGICYNTPKAIKIFCKNRGYKDIMLWCSHKLAQEFLDNNI